MGDVKEGAPEFLGAGAVITEAGAGGEVEYPEAEDGEEEDAGDPDVAGCVVLLEAGNQIAAGEREYEGQDGGQELGGVGVGVGLGDGDRCKGEAEDQEGHRGVGGEPEDLSEQVRDRFAGWGFLMQRDGHGLRVLGF